MRKLAQLYGGDATVKSEKGKGSIFTVTLQDAGRPQTGTGAAQSRSRRADAGSGNVTAAQLRTR